MSFEGAFTVEGVVTDVISEKTCRARLANGHVVFCFLVGADCGKVSLVRGREVKLKLSPYDLSEGRIIGGRNEI